MNNFTKSNGKAYWQSITNLTCCIRKLNGNLKSSTTSLLLVMLFLFSVSSLNAQISKDQTQTRSSNLNLCLEDIPEPFSEDDVADLFDFLCDEGDEAIAVLQDYVITGQDGTGEGTDCSWAVVYTYDIYCKEVSGDPLDKFIVDYDGGDTEAPQLVGEVPSGGSNLNLCYNEIPDGPSEAEIAALFTDNCGNVNVTKSGQPAGNDCDWTVTYLYKIEDDCSNAAGDIEITYSGGDDEAPELGKDAVLPTGETGLNVCYDDRPMGPTEAEVAALFTDNCGNINVTKTSNFKGDDCGWKGEVMYVIEDDCGNAFEPIILSYNGGDTEDPVLDSFPNDFEVSCIDVIPSAESITFTDNCTDGKNKATSSDDTSGLGIACEGGVVIRTWTATDDCGNSSSHSITITVLPAPPAEFEDPAGYSIDCSEVENHVPQPLGYSNGAQGACLIEGEAQGSAASFEGSCGEFEVSYEFTDECGRTITAVRIVTVTDTTPPTINPASDLTVECDGAGNATDLAEWLANNGGATATDDCGNVSWSNNAGDLSDECGATGSVTVEFTATDDCGNSDKTTATFTIEDTTPPTIEVPAQDLTVECDGAGNQADYEGWLANNGGASASDICGDVSWSAEIIDAGEGCGNTGYYIVRFTATDECNNSDYTDAKFEIEDTTPPTLDPGASDLTVECDGQGNLAELQAWLDSNGGASATDICNDVTWTNDFTGLSDDCGETGTATVIFTATDSCDNKAETSATFTIVDTASPPITTEAQDASAECDGAGNQADLQAWLDINGGAIASDICSDISWSYNVGDFVPACGLTGSYTVMFTVTDDCGLSSSTEATFYIIDTTNPSIDLAAQPLTVECDGSGNQAEFDAWIADNGGAEASDSCGDVSWTYENPGLSDECGATGSVTIIFTAHDECGNTSKTEAIFTIEDTTPPLIDPEAADLTVECDGQGNQADFQGWLDSNGGASATDDCGSVSWGYAIIDSAENCGNTGYYIVQFTATDECGLTASTQAKFEIEDTTPPLIDPMASDETIECLGPEGNAQAFQDWLDSNGGASATDVCNNFEWTYIITGSTDDCGYTGSYTVEFIATDECDNSSKTTATFTIEDTTPPTIDPGASDLKVECDGQGNLQDLEDWLNSNGGASATDICGDVSWSNNFTGLSDLCGETGSATVEFTATDECGNSDKTTATFTIEDTTPPAFDPEAQDLTVECDGAGNQAELEDWLNNNGYAQAFDQCGGVTWSNDFSGLSDDCGATGSATVIFTAEDECGLISTTSATFTIVDTTDPYFTYVPEDIVLECDQDKPVADATADDVCGSADVTYLDYYDYTPWQAIITGGDGSVDLSALPNGFTAVSSDTGSLNTYIAVASTVVKPQTISFDWTFSTSDPGWEQFITIVNGAVTVHADGNSAGSFSTDLAAGDSFSAGVLTVDDQLGNSTLVATNLTMTPIDLECPVTDCFIRQFTATDECGNTATAEQLVTFVDTTPPVIDPGASDLTVECDGSGNQAELAAWLASNGGASATDNCGEVTWSHNCYNPWIGFMNVFEVTGAPVFGAPWGVPDLVTLVDENTNTLTLKPNRIGDPDPFWNTDGELFGNKVMDASTYVENDALLGQAISFNGNVTSNTLDPEYAYYAFIRIFTADYSSVTEIQASLDGGPFSVETDGTIAPAGGHVQYGFNVRGRNVNPHPDFDAAYEALGSIVIEAAECILADDCGATGSVTVTFTATDDCGNASQTTATFTIIDTTAPTLDTPAADLTVECDGEGNQAELEAWLESNGGASASDDCSDVSWSYDCGEQASGIVFNCIFDPQNEANAAIITFGAPTGNAGGYDVFDLGSAVFSGLPGSAYGYSLTYNSDLTRWECHEILEQGDSGFLIWYSDGDVPSPSCDPADWTDAGPFCNLLEVDCPEECKLTDECGATGSVTVEFTATDECGNPVSTTATFTIVDTTDPVITTPPADLTVECDGAGNQAELDAWLASYAGAQGEDACGDATWSHNFSGLSDECGATGSAMVEFTLTDECGNEVKDTATFTIEDTTPPSIDVEASDQTVECGPDNAAQLQNWLDTIGLTGAASDQCGGVTWSNDFDALSDLCGLTGAATVEFTATDECGLTSKTTATFTIEDTTPPVLVGEEPGNLNGLNLCYNEMPEPPSLEEIAALFFEVCGEVIVELQSTPVGDDCGWSVLHVYTIKDECDNYAVDQVKIFYSGGDNTKPEIDGVPDDTTADCENIPAKADPTATDNCDLDVDLQFNEVITPGNCDGNYTITRTWTATDDCGNTTVEQQIITVQDTTPPVLTGQLPPFETWGINSCQPEGDYGPSAQDIADQYTDNCSGVMVTKEIKSNNGNDCGWIIDIEYVVKDNCGNVADTFKLWFNGSDMNPPTIVDSEQCNNENFLLTTSQGADCPADAGTSLEPGHTVDKDNPDFTVAGLPFHFDGLTPCFEDDCTDKNDLRFVVDTVDIQKDDCPALITITFNVLDICGNAYEGFVCYFYITDDELPVLECPEPQDLGANPNIDPATGIPLGLVDKVPFTDNCDLDGLATDFIDTLSSEPKVYVDRLLTSEADFSGGEQHINFDAYPLPGGGLEFIVGNEYNAEGVNFTSPSGIAIIDPNIVFALPGIASSQPQTLVKANSDGQDTPLVIEFSGVVNRIGFYLATNNIDDITFSAQCYLNGTEVGNEFFITDLTATFYGFESASGFDRVVLTAVGESNDILFVDDLRYEGGGTDWTLDREFSYTDACDNTGYCTATFTWCETEDLPPYTDDGPPPTSASQQDANMDVELDFLAYPVPFDKEVSVKYNFEFDTDVSISVFDTKGLLIWSETHNNQSRNMDHSTKLDLSRGGDQVFYIHLTTNRGTVVKKVVSSGLKRN